MVIVDDRLSIEVFAGRPLPGVEPDVAVATTWCFHFRLVRALADPRLVGHLSREATEAVRERAENPPADTLVVLDPRRSTALAAALASEHQLNLVAAELLAAARLHRASVLLAAPNVGRGWPEAFAAAGVELRVA
jgi:hypothetical protein